MSDEFNASRLIDLILSGDISEAQQRLTKQSSIVESDFYLACATGHHHHVARLLAEEESLATRLGGPRGWEPLLYTCHSRFLGHDGEIANRLVQVARCLLDHGANPNAYFKINDDPNAKQTCLYGAAGIANHAAMTQLLLEAGADPNDGAPGLGPESLYHASEFADTTCLKLILAAKPAPQKVSYCLRRKLDFHHSTEGVRLFLEHGADPNDIVPGRHDGTPFHAAIRRLQNVSVLEALHQFGADLTLQTPSGHTPYALAVRLGHDAAADFCLVQGAREEEASLVDQVIGHCMNGRESAARQLVASLDAFQQHLALHDHAVVAEAAMHGRLEAVQPLLHLGFRIDVANDTNQMQPLHWAGWQGNHRLVELLLQFSPPLEPVNRYGGTPLDAAVYGFTHCPTAQGDYLITIQRLLDAGCDANRVTPYPTGRPEIDSLVGPYRSE